MFDAYYLENVLLQNFKSYSVFEWDSVYDVFSGDYNLDDLVTILCCYILLPHVLCNANT